MIKNNTVLIVGAGASSDLGLPLGSGLQKAIVDLICNPQNSLHRPFIGTLKSVFDDSDARTSQTINYCKNFKDAMLTAHSIDNFVDQHRHMSDFVSAIKLAIVFIISLAEKKSKINHDSAYAGDILSRTRHYFLQHVLKIAARNNTAETISASLENLCIITFNYDRCIERYFDIWTHFYFRSDDIRPPEVIHVYVDLGTMKDLITFDEASVSDPIPNPHLTLPKAEERIKTFTEVVDSQLTDIIDERVKNADCIISLGFGFEEQNLAHFGTGNARVFATMKSKGKANIDFLQRSLTAKFGSGTGTLAKITDGTCAELFDEHYHDITDAMGSL